MLTSSYSSGSGFVQSQLTPSEILGISAYRKQSEKRLKAATDPKNYLQDRINAEKEIEANIQKTYNDAIVEFGSIPANKEVAVTAVDKDKGLSSRSADKLQDYKYSNAEVQELALIKAKGVRDALLAKLEADYPVEYNKVADATGARQAELKLAAKGGYRPVESASRPRRAPGKRKAAGKRKRAGKRK